MERLLLTLSPVLVTIGVAMIILGSAPVEADSESAIWSFDENWGTESVDITLSLTNNPGVKSATVTLSTDGLSISRIQSLSDTYYLLSDNLEAGKFVFSTNLTTELADISKEETPLFTITLDVTSAEDGAYTIGMTKLSVSALTRVQTGSGYAYQYDAYSNNTINDGVVHKGLPENVSIVFHSNPSPLDSSLDAILTTRSVQPVNGIVTLPSVDDPVNGNFEFLGWYASPDYTERDGSTSITQVSVGSSSTIPVYAHWKGVYIDWYNASSGSNVSYDRSWVAPGDTVSAPSGKPVAYNAQVGSRWYFVGWNTTADPKPLYPLQAFPDASEDTAYYATFVIRGDVDGDGKFDSNDVIHALYIILTPSTSRVSNQDLDFNKDGKVDYTDAVRMLYAALIEEHNFQPQT